MQHCSWFGEGKGQCVLHIGHSGAHQFEFVPPIRGTSKKTLSQRIADADAWGSRYLADANEARERGDIARAEKLERKCQFWLDRSNLLRGNGPAP